MPEVHVCSLARIGSVVAATRARHLVSLVAPGTPVERPAAILEPNHLFLGFNDIVEPAPEMVMPAAEHVESLIAFVSRWERSEPLVVHCFAGISRSTAAAFITLCALKPGRSEAEIATRLRAASRIATPNLLLVTLADGILRRDGRMVEAIRAIGRGETAAEGNPFALTVEG